MGVFSGKINAEFNPPRMWKLSEPLGYTVYVEPQQVSLLRNLDIDISNQDPPLQKNYYKITVPKGFATDLASTPRIAWSLVAPWDIARAAIIHDYLYRAIRDFRRQPRGLTGKSRKRDKKYIRQVKKLSDIIFLAGMRDAAPSVAKYKIYNAYWAVRLFGRWSILPSKIELGE